MTSGGGKSSDVSGAESIAVLGGGVSGLTFASALQRLSSKRVTVFERQAEVGGKCCTVNVDGRPHDFGATMGVPIDYRHVLRSSRAMGIANVRFPEERHYSLGQGGSPGKAVALNTWSEMPAVLAEAAKYMGLHASRWSGADGRGLHRAPAGLHRPWTELVARHDLGIVSRRLLAYRTGYGYGYDDEVPALMYANLFRPATFLGLAVGHAFMWEGGTQPIWQALARTLDVRAGTSVEKIERGPSGVTIHSRAGGERRTDRFDSLVVTCNPKNVLPVLDATAAERRWFSQVRSYPYATFACEVSGLSPGRASVGYLDENMVRGREGHPMAWVKRYADQDVYVFHLFAPEALSDDDCLARIAEDVSRLGGRVVRPCQLRRWQFFPHFPVDFMEGGGLSEIERWQGSTHTFLIGEVLSFATMARVAELAVRLARRLAVAPLMTRPASPVALEREVA